MLFPSKIRKVKNVLTQGKRVPRLQGKICQIFSTRGKTERKGQWGRGVSAGDGLTWE